MIAVGLGELADQFTFCVHNRVCDSLLRSKLGDVYHSRLEG